MLWRWRWYRRRFDSAHGILLPRTGAAEVTRNSDKNGCWPELATTEEKAQALPRHDTHLRVFRFRAFLKAERRCIDSGRWSGVQRHEFFVYRRHHEISSTVERSSLPSGPQPQKSAEGEARPRRTPASGRADPLTGSASAAGRSIDRRKTEAFRGGRRGSSVAGAARDPSQ